MEAPARFSQSAAGGLLQPEGPIKGTAQVIRLLRSGEGGNPGSVWFEEEQGDVADVVQLRKGPTFWRVQAGDDETDAAFVFRLERVDHSLELTAEASARVMDLYHNVLPLPNGRKVRVFGLKSHP